MIRLINEEAAPVEEVEVAEEEAVEEVPVAEEVNQNAYGDLIVGLVKEAWTMIGSVTAAIATIDANYTKENKDEIQQILNSIIDDITIEIGMLYKVTDMIDEKTEQLLDAGAAKAEEIINQE